ncbi:uncharacterized protein LOC108951944 isoform X2 [Musa acuminata AAA Group]|uniref:uncharacterized protein LOC108951944 isoform X2 n=1 Tax=Musa acuminata AAA Group TaxID=214697 RepID=UPI0031D00D91
MIPATASTKELFDVFRARYNPIIVNRQVFAGYSCVIIESIFLGSNNHCTKGTSQVLLRFPQSLCCHEDIITIFSGRTNCGGLPTPQSHACQPRKLVANDYPPTSEFHDWPKVKLCFQSLLLG